MIRPARMAARQTAQKPKTHREYTFPGPTLGLMAMNNLAVAVPGGATILRNFFPTPTGARMRRGKALYATLGTGGMPVSSIFSYVVGNQRELFAATEDAVYNITTITDPSNTLLGTEGGDMLGTEEGDMIGWLSTDGKDVLSDMNGGKWVTEQFATAGGSFLIGVNGADPSFVYDGADFADASITFPDVGGDPSPLTTADLVYVWAYKNRLWFLQKDSLSAWYLPVDQVAGELTEFPLGGVLTKGGRLEIGTTWSQDLGNGLNALCAFISSEGEAAVYQGASPDEATDWGLVGVYQTGKPLGSKAHVKVGGDIVMAADVAFVPLSEALRREYSQLGANSLSAPIEALWPQEVELRSNADWNCAFWSEQQMILVALPNVYNRDPGMLVVNSRTGKWARFTNWGATAIHVFNGRLFFGDEKGQIFEGNVTGLDAGVPYTASCLPSFDQMDAPGHKTVSMARAVIKAPYKVNALLSTHSDYDDNLPPAPPATLISAPGAWGDPGTIWGKFAWGNTSGVNVQQVWETQFGAGEVISEGIQITSGSIVPLDAELIRIDVVFSVDGVVGE